MIIKIKTILLVLFFLLLATACGKQDIASKQNAGEVEKQKKEKSKIEKSDEDIEKKHNKNKSSKKKHSEKDWDFEVSPYGMPELMLTNDSIVVLDDNHPELAKALEEKMVLPEDAISQAFILCRIDDSIVSFERLCTKGNAEVSFVEYEFLVFSTMGEQLTLDNVGENIIDNCHDMLVESYNEYIGPSYDLNAGDVNLINEDTPWIIDANSIAFFLSSDEYDYVPYRIYFDDNPFINPKVIPDGDKLYSYICSGYFSHGKDTIYSKRGSVFDVGTFKSLECGLYVNGNDHNYLYDVIDNVTDPINGVVVNVIYIDDCNDLYVFSNGYYREVNAINGVDKHYFYGIYKLKRGELSLLAGRTYGAHLYDDKLGHYTYDDAYYNNIHIVPYDEGTLEIIIENSINDKE